MKAYSLTVLVLFMFIVLTSLALVVVKHKSRTLFINLQNLNKQEVFLDEQWGRLLLQQSTQLAHDRVEHVARNKLQMKLPESKQIVVVR